MACSWVKEGHTQDTAAGLYLDSGECKWLYDQFMYFNDCSQDSLSGGEIGEIGKDDLDSARLSISNILNDFSKFLESLKKVYMTDKYLYYHYSDVFDYAIDGKKRSEINIVKKLSIMAGFAIPFDHESYKQGLMVSSGGKQSMIWFIHNKIEYMENIE